MSRVRAGEVDLGWRTWGEGDITVVFIHGNLACKEWIEFAAPLFREGLGAIKAFFEGILDKTFGVSEGIWIGTPFNLNRERESGELERRMPQIRHPHLVLWGEKDGWIPPADLKRMAEAMPNCRLVTVPSVGHSMNLEQPELYAGYFGAWFGGIPSDASYQRSATISAQTR